MQIASASSVAQDAALFDACRAFAGTDDLLRELEAAACAGQPSEVAFDVVEEPRLAALARVTLIGAVSAEGLQAKAAVLGRLLDTELREPLARRDALLRSLIADILAWPGQGVLPAGIEDALGAEGGPALPCGR
ncbi:hypothetical protein BKE38_03910 [Pseudoroseomonas deserti]|uniref:Uncharacterized protein n=1 Tax=Teichococcus deserti TaxID=1817963 RepID=A0A1V2H6T6_9PROT|nr:hypothetical protein [Pseudoroseomonas deserti]ONG57867.1 hypothetical protein BKE38_03910 [Pseudoroseomonas deserti]